jgi:opacity protein-like surface antigen
MIRCGKLAVALLLGAAAASPAAGQTPIVLFAGAGPSFPMGDFADGADTGWMLGGGVLAIIGTQGLWVGAEGMYGKNGTSVDDVSVSHVGGGGMVGFTMNRGARISPYVFGGAGVLSSKLEADGAESESESEFAWSVGGGLTLTMSPRASLFAGARYMDAGDLTMVPVTLGILYYMGQPPQ